MRRIAKHHTPECLQDFIDAQLAIEPEPVNLTYRDFPRKTELRAILAAEQLGLCGYTGAPVDERISSLTTANAETSFTNHVEHLKCQQKCREELIAQGKEYGRDLGEDLDYANMIAALEVRGSESEHFGAVAKANKPLPVFPTHDDCDLRFVFNEGDGSVTGVDEDANTSIDVLRLNHDTLKDWRKSAIEAWLDPEVVKSREDFEAIQHALEQPVDGKLPEYAFVVGSVVRGYL